jgi:hypothetical protein
MPRYLSPRKAAKYKDVIAKITKAIQSGKYESFVIEGPPSALYDDLWTIRSQMFKEATARFKYKKQFSGVWIEILPEFNSSDPIEEVFDGISIEDPVNRGAMAAKLIAEKPKKVRFNKSHLTELDIEKLAKLSNDIQYTVLVNDTYITFTAI